MKIDHHKEEHIKFASVCRSLAHPTRIAIIEKIAEKQNCIDSEIVPVISTAETTVVKHLRDLKKEGLIKGRVTRHNMSYCIDWDKLDEFKKLFDQLYKQVKRHRENVTCNKGDCA